MTSLISAIQRAFEAEEARTVSDSFGGTRLAGRTPSFNVPQITKELIQHFESLSHVPAAIAVRKLGLTLGSRAFISILESLVRFSFLIELTNVNITSTKMKTRWVPGLILRTRAGSFSNYKGEFSPGNDQRSSSFDTCFEVFHKSLSLLTSSQAHIDIAVALESDARRSISYEGTLTYIDPTLSTVHHPDNVRLAVTDDINWLTKARPIFRNILEEPSREKIRVKSFLTDRSQTGTDQTNRAKRWEILSGDFQHATLEECWSVQRKLLSDLTFFTDFPEDKRQELQDANLSVFGGLPVVCPVTHKELNFPEFVQSSAHGRAVYQVGHLMPLKLGGRHTGSNVAWVTDHGNRIQGDLSIEDVRKMLWEVAERMRTRGI